MREWKVLLGVSLALFNLLAVPAACYILAVINCMQTIIPSAALRTVVSAVLVIVYFWVLFWIIVVDVLVYHERRTIFQ